MDQSNDLDTVSTPALPVGLSAFDAVDTLYRVAFTVPGIPTPPDDVLGALEILAEWTGYADDGHGT